MIGRMTGWLRGTPRLESERGLALVLVIFALVILGAVVSGAFVVSRFDRRAADNSVLAGEAQNAAETGLATLYATWDPLVHNLMPIWDGTPATEWSGGLQTVGGSPTQVYVDSVRRFNNELFLVRSFGARLGPGGQVMSQLAVAQLFRIAKPTIGVNAAITVQDPVTFNGNAFLVSGINANPPQWGAGECDPLDPTGVDDVVGVRSAVATGVNHPQDDDNVFGFPAPDAANDPTITSATFQNFLDYTYTTLASQPGVKVLANSTPYNGVAPVLDGTGACDRAVLLNLGEPWRNPPTGGALPACYPYFPVVHGTGAETEFAAGNRGQGVLLVDGDLKMTGGFEWVGLIIVRGKVHISGNGNKITGAILAEGANVSSSGAVSGDVDVQYSKCAIDKAIGGSSLGRPVNQRSWLQVY